MCYRREWSCRKVSSQRRCSRAFWESRAPTGCMSSSTLGPRMRLAIVVLLALGCGPRDTAHPTPPAPVDARAPADVAPVAAKPACPPAIVRMRDIDALRAAVAGCNGNAFDGPRCGRPRRRRPGRTAWMAAAGDVAAVEVLLGEGADPNAALEVAGSAEVGQTALWFAIASSGAEVVQRLLAAHADPNLFSPAGLPLLVLAVPKDSVPIARLLVDAKIPRSSGAMRRSPLTSRGSDDHQRA